MTPETNAPSDVAIITVSYNSSAQLASFLAGAIASVASPGQVLVVDNNSGDADITSALCTSWGATMVPLEKNLGYGGAINKAVEKLPASIKYLIISNPDVELNPGSISILRSELVLNKDFGTVGPKILNTDGSTYPSARSIPSISHGIGHAVFANIWPRNPWTTQYHSDAYLADITQETGWVSGACLGVSRETFEHVSGFDENYFMYFEDVDLGYRLKNLGFKNVYTPAATVTHIGGESTKTVKAQMLKIHHASAVRFLSVRYPGTLWAPVRGILKLGLAVRLRIQLRSAV